MIDLCYETVCVGNNETSKKEQDSNMKHDSILVEDKKTSGSSEFSVNVFEKLESDSDDDDAIISANQSRQRIFRSIQSDDEDENFFLNSNTNKMVGSSPDRVSSPGLVSETEPALSSESKGKRRIFINDSDDSDDDPCESNDTHNEPQGLHEEDKGLSSHSHHEFKNFESEESDDEKDPTEDSSHLSDHSDDYRKNEEEYGTKPKGSSKKHSYKKRQQELQEIHSTTQKMIRDSELSLPYHRPKQRTLMEFLNRKKPFKTQDKHVSLKMSMRDLNHLREIEERKKEVDEFFKSDSENEEEKEEVKEEEEEEVVKGEKEKEVVKEESKSEAETFSLPIEANSSSAFKETKENDEGESTHCIRSLIKELNYHSSDHEETTHLHSQVDLETKAKESDLEEPSQDPLVADKEFVSSKDVLLISKDEDEDDDDMMLRLNTEDFEETQTGKTETENFGQLSQHPKIGQNDDDNDGGSLSKQKLGLLVSKYPTLKLREITSVKPRLSTGGEGDIIDLEEECLVTPERKEGVKDLLHRFVKHSNTKGKPTTPQHVTLGVVSKEVSAEGEENLVHSNVSVTVEDEEPLQQAETPGARWASLKKNIRAQLIEQRERERQRRLKEKQFMDSERVIQDYYDDGLPDEEAELSDLSESEAETESEPEENDVVMNDEKQERNQYVDDEADVDDDVSEEGNREHHQSRRDDDFENDSNSDVEMDDANGKSSSENNDDENMMTLKKKVCNRILDDDEDDSASSFHKKDAPDDDDDEDDLKLRLEDTENQETEVGGTLVLSRSNTEDLFSSQTQKAETKTNSESMDSSLDWTGNSLPVQQPKKQSSLESPSDDLLNSSALTLFSKLDYGRRDSFTQETDNCLSHQSAMNFLLTPQRNSQTTSYDDTQTIKRSLFLDPSSSSVSKDKPDEELLGLCSGDFTANGFSDKTQNLEDVVGLCSGKFVTQDSSVVSAMPLVSQSSGELFEHSHERQESASSLSKNGVSSADTVDGSKSESGDLEGAKEEQAVLVYSSDEDGILQRQRSDAGKKKRKRIVALSDNESSADESESEAESVEYDENEEPIIKQKFNGFKDNVRGGIRSDFLEKEAELSGSDEASDDEEEPNEDDDFMEREDGDMDTFDEDELRNQVGRAHMKSLIDSDKREVRLLQEMYLEDGDLHGEGRQRKFRWKNMDDVDDGETKKSDDEEEENEKEIEDEAEWRQQRIEREKFLREQREKEKEPSSSTYESPVLTLERSVSLKLSTKPKSSIKVPLRQSHSQDSPLFLNMTNKRGSFLSRDQSTLKRLAEFTKETTTVVGGARQGGNFVFQTITKEEMEIKKMKEEQKERKENLSKIPPAKRKRLERCFFSMDESVQNTSIFKHL